MLATTVVLISNIGQFVAISIAVATGLMDDKDTEKIETVCKISEISKVVKL
jgi:hypothetical protein